MEDKPKGIKINFVIVMIHARPVNFGSHTVLCQSKTSWQAGLIE
jgi:hypothetical protein